MYMLMFTLASMHGGFRHDNVTVTVAAACTPYRNCCSDIITILCRKKVDLATHLEI